VTIFTTGKSYASEAHMLHGKYWSRMVLEARKEHDAGRCPRHVAARDPPGSAAGTINRNEQRGVGP